MSMDKEEKEELTKIKLIDSVLEVNNQETESSSPNKNLVPSSVASSIIQVAEKFEDDFSKMVDAICQKQKTEFQGYYSDPIDIFTEEIVLDEFEVEIELIKSQKEQFIFEIPKKLKNFRLEVKNIQNRFFSEEI